MRAAGPTCVWLHGTALAGLRWHASLPGVWPLLPGHGTAPRVTPTVEAFADALAPTLPRSCVLGGHSLGGMVALTLAARLGDRCRGLVLVETPLRLPRYIPRLAWLAPLMAWPKPLGLIVQFRTSNPSMRPTVRKTVAATPRKGLIDAMQAALGFDGRALAQTVSQPVLSLLGAHSPLTTASDGVGEVHTFPDAAHMLPVDAPEETAHLIRRFIARLP